MSWVSAAWTWYAANSDKVNPIVAGLGGAALVWAAIQQARTATRRHYEQTRADQQRRLTESFSKAVEQLASDKVEARLGGIYTLERLAIEAIAQVRPPKWRRLRRNRPPPANPVADLYWTVMETLTAFVRERARWQEAKSIATGTPTDIAAVLAVICRRPEAGRKREQQRSWCFDLSMTDLRGANLVMAHLEGVFLATADLERSLLMKAHLEGAHLYGAHLEGANLMEAHLERANLLGATLGRVSLEGAILAEAHLEGVDLSTAYGDALTRLPDGVERPPHWPAYDPDAR
jgi:hypothetical protein